MVGPRVTFVIPTHNQCAQVLKTLSLLRATVGRLAHEILVIDNGCTDNTVQAVADRFPQVRFIELTDPCDAAARNLGLCAAQANFVFMLDDATWCDKDATENGLQMMAEQPRLAAAECRIRPLGGLLRSAPRGPAGVFAGSGVLLRRQAILEVGGYPIDASDLAEQYDLCARLWQADWQVRRFESMPAWREPRTSPPDANLVLRVLTANSLRFWSKYAPEDQQQAILEETIEGFRCVAEKASALAGFEEGLVLGLAAARHNRAHRHPLTPQQMNSLFGPDQSPLQLPLVPAGVPTAA
jgi:GT2 family glycosyltransferase